MPTPLASNCLYRVISFVISNIEGIEIVDYGDRESFRKLWREDLESKVSRTAESPAAASDAVHVLVIVGNNGPAELFESVPEGIRMVNFRDHLTAASWAAAWRIKHPESPTRIVLLGSDAKTSSGGVTHALNAIFHCGGPGMVSNIHRLDSPPLESLCRQLRHSTGVQTGQDFPVHACLRTIIWEGLTSDREGHHAISNVLGALLLSSQVGSGAVHPGDPWVQDYLLSLVQACGASATTVPTEFDPSKAAQGRHQVWISRDLKARLTGAVLLDDMADIWEYFLRGATGFYGSDSSRFVTTPRAGFGNVIDGLPARLQGFVDSGRRHISADVLIPGHHEVTEEFALFLDLRLFSNTTAGKSSRENFLQELAKVGLGLLQSGRILPWLEEDARHQFAEELTMIARGGTSQGDARQHRSLPPEDTLLPRLLSLLDPALPIILFSSTHRTELVEPFKRYGNILTSFRKPVLTGMTGNWGDMVRTLRDEFVETLEHASRIMRGRRVLNVIERRSQVASPSVLPAHDHGCLVEFFLDESEEPTHVRPPRAVCAGGIAVIRSLGSDGRPVVSDTDIYSRLSSSGCLWGWCADTPPGFARPQNTPRHRAFMPKGGDLNFGGQSQGVRLLESMLASIRGTLGDSGLVLPFAAISQRARVAPEWMDIPGGTDAWAVEKGLDATLRRLVQHVLESLFFRSSLLRPIFDHPASCIGVDLATRSYPCKENLPLQENFGFELWRGWRPSFQSEDGYQITAETIARRGLSWPFKSRIGRARAVALKDFGSFPDRPQGVLPKQLHYFADMVAHVALDDFAAATSSSADIRAFFESGWIADFRQDVEQAERMEIGRAWDQGDRVVAMLWAADLKRRPEMNGLGIDIFREINAGIPKLTGPELMQLFSRA